MRGPYGNPSQYGPTGDAYMLHRFLLVLLKHSAKKDEKELQDLAKGLILAVVVFTI